MINWKTSLAAFMAAVGQGLTASPDPNMHLAGQVLSPIGMLLTGLFAADASPKQ